MLGPHEIRRVFGYVRVSTAAQDDSGAGLQAQRSAIREECRRRGWKLVHVYQDVASGKSTNGRPELAQALTELRKGYADALIAAKLDRVSRSVVDFGRLLEQAQRESWSLIVLDLGLDMSTSVGELMANVLVSVAQFERRRIGERTKAAMAAVKARGPAPGKLDIGRPRQVAAEIEARITEQRRAGASYVAIAAGLDADSVPTANGRPWNWTSVRRIAQRQLDEPVRTRRRPRA